MTDQEIIQGLIARDNRVTEEFFFDKCRPLFVNIINLVFSYKVDYDALPQISSHKCCITPT